MTQRTQIDDIRTRLDRPLVIVGMPASGKTALGQGISQLLGLPFIDLDREIETAANRTIAAIFENDGESAFRDLEGQVLQAVFENSVMPCVISTGGGAVLRPANGAFIFDRGLAVWVQASIPVLLERTARETHRPLLKNGNPEKTLRDLESARTPLYQRAQIIVQSDGRMPADIFPELITKIHERLS